MPFHAPLVEHQWLLAVMALVLACVVREGLSYRRLRHFKGPPGAAISNLWHTRACLSGRCHEYYADVSEKYGPLARIAPNILITSSPELWAKINGVRSRYTRTKWFYRACQVEPGFDNVFSQTDDALHEKRRKQMAAGYAGKENVNLERNMDANVQNLIGLLRSHYLSSDALAVPVDLAQKIAFFTMDVISTIGLGKSFGMLERDGDDYAFLQSLEEGLKMTSAMACLGLTWLLRVPVLGAALAPSPRDTSGFGKMMATAFAFVDERVASPAGTEARSDMLASFIRHGLHGHELRTEALEQVIAGSDTTAGSLRAILLYLLCSPRVYTKLQAEVDEAVRAGRAPRAPAIITAAQAGALPYLQAVIREGLRIWPSVTHMFPRDVPPEGETVTLHGKTYFLPGGTNIGYSAVAMHRNTALYGADAKIFRPERWLEEKDAGRLAAMVRTNDLVFGHGKFHCLGKPVAQMEIGKVIFELMRHFNWTLCYPERPWKTINYLGLFVIHDMWAQATAREE